MAEAFSSSSSCSDATTSHDVCDKTRTKHAFSSTDSVTTANDLVERWYAIRRGCSCSGTVLHAAPPRQPRTECMGHMRAGALIQCSHAVGGACGMRERSRWDTARCNFPGSCLAQPPRLTLMVCRRTGCARASQTKSPRLIYSQRAHQLHGLLPLQPHHMHLAAATSGHQLVDSPAAQGTWARPRELPLAC